MQTTVACVVGLLVLVHGTAAVTVNGITFNSFNLGTGLRSRAF